MTEVWLELFLFDNVLMSYLIIRIAHLAARIQTRNWGIAAACLLSAAASAFAMVYPFLLSLPVKIVLSLVMTLLPFRIRTWKEGLRCMGCVLLSTFLLGGMAYALPNILESTFKSGVLYAEGSVRIVLLALVLSTFIPSLVESILRRKRFSGYDLELRIVTEYGASETKARIDTGNLLYDTVSKLPVIVADLAAVKNSMPSEWTQVDWMNHPVKGMVLIPFKSIGGSGLMPALPVKEAYWQKEGAWIACKPCLVALAKGRLAGEFGAIMNADCVEGDR